MKKLTICRTLVYSNGKLRFEKIRSGACAGKILTVADVPDYFLNIFLCGFPSLEYWKYWDCFNKYVHLFKPFKAPPLQYANPSNTASFRPSFWVVLLEGIRCTQALWSGFRNQIFVSRGSGQKFHIGSTWKIYMFFMGVRGGGEGEGWGWGVRGGGWGVGVGVRGEGEGGGSRAPSP